MFKRSLSLSTAIAALFCAPAFAGTQTIAFSTSPVAVNSFHVDTAFVSGIIGGEAQSAPEFVTSGVTLKFTNTAHVAAKTVEFVIHSGSAERTIVDTGTFSPGVQIVHSFAASDLDTFGATIDVAQVDFADGSVWHGRTDMAQR